MKTLIATTLVSVLASSSYAGKVEDQGKSINAQVEITRDTLQQVLAQMKNAPGTMDTFSNPDFVEAAARVNARAERAMIKFEKTLKDDILPKVNFFINRLNSIKNAYVGDQQTALLKDQTEGFEQEMINLSGKYKDAIYDLKTAIVPAHIGYISGDAEYSSYLGKLKVTFMDPSLGSYEFNRGDTVYKENRDFVSKQISKGEASFRPLSRNMYDNDASAEIKRIFFDPSIRNLCWTSSCVTLLSNHLKNYLSLIDMGINKNLVFEFGLTLQGLYTNEREPSSFIKHLLSTTTNETKDLPFNISDDEFAQRKNERIQQESSRRQDKIKQLHGVLNNKIFFGTWKCDVEKVKGIKSHLCNSYTGCISESESSEIISAIKETFPEFTENAVRLKCFAQE